MAPHRLNRTEAYAKWWGDEAYALEELTVEITAAILCAELGISEHVTPAQREKHLANHVGYLQSWLKVLSKDPLAIFTAAKAAERVSEYVWGSNVKPLQCRSMRSGSPNTTPPKHDR
jgi:antirestriction protein ArdC